MFGQLAKGILFFFCFIAILEFSIRLAMPEYNPTKHLAFSWHHENLILGQPNTVQRQIKNTGDFNVEVRFNRYGLRDSNDIQSADHKDFILVGDSFSFGWGVEETERLGEQLAEKIGRHVYNAAVPGDLDTYERLIDYAFKLADKPLRVIIGLNMETDILPYRAEVSAPVTDLKKSEPSAFNLMAVKAILTRHFSVYFLMTQQVHQHPILREHAVSLGLIRPNLNASLTDVPDETAIAATVRRMSQIAALFKATVIIIPSRYTWFGPRQQALSTIHEEISRDLAARNIDILDLKPVFEADGAPLEYHFENDGHWRPAGHAKAAEVLARHLKVRFGNAL